MMGDLVNRARTLARQKHQGQDLPDQVRTPIFEHITEVAELVSGQGGTEAMTAAAWLHDIVEDTDVTLQQIADGFGAEVHLLVSGLTDPEHFESLPLELRKQLQADRIRDLSDDVKRIKLCDQLSNTRRVLKRPPSDWSADRQWIYIQGAGKIAWECRGLWPLLDEEFAVAFAAAEKRFLTDS